LTEQGVVVAEAFADRGAAGPGVAVLAERASAVEWGTVFLPNEPDLRPDQLQALLAESGRGEPREFRVSADAFSDLVSGGCE